MTNDQAPMTKGTASTSRGFTLLEVILAAGLTAVILLIIASGIDVQWRAFEASRAHVEHAQLARVLTRRIADDLCGLLPPGTETPTVSSSQSDADETSESLDEDEEDEIDPGDPAAPGLHGELDSLRVDVVRTACRVGSLSSTDSAPQTMHAVKTITYYVVSPEDEGQAVDTDSEQPVGGLVRRELPRSAAAWSARSGQLDYQDDSARPLVPEVKAVEFRYHDGEEWLDSWESSVTGALPKAIEVRLFFAPRQRRDAFSQGSDDIAFEAVDRPDVEYRLVVPILVQAASPSAFLDGATAEGTSLKTSGSGDGSNESGDKP